MSFLTGLMKASIFALFVLQWTISLPVLGRYLEEEDSITRMDSFSPKELFPRDESDLRVDLRSGSRRSWLQARQLGDIEFTNRYAELLKSKAKVTSMCSFLKRMENSKKSGAGGDSERLMYLIKQYSCPNIS